MRSACLPALSLVLVAALTLVAGRAFAGDPFEIQVYDGTANAPGVPGLELHLNHWATGRRALAPPVSPLHGQFHATLEPSLGVLPFWELGLYLQGALRTDDGAFDWAGVKFRSKFVTPPGWDRRWRLGVNLEVSYLPTRYDRDGWGSEVRPIVAWQDERWLFALNPIFDQSLTGGGVSDGPSFQPAFKVARSVGPLALGLEYYGTLGPIAAPLPLHSQEHLLFEAIDILSVECFELNAGLGEGLTEASAGIIVKAIIGYTFEAPTRKLPLAASTLWRRVR